VLVPQTAYWHFIACSSLKLEKNIQITASFPKADEIASTQDLRTGLIILAHCNLSSIHNFT
jgi:hypothetical protein